MDPLVILIVFGVIALAELPDKSLFASLVLGTRYPARWVFTGVAAAFLAHVVIAVTAGGVLSLLPHRVVEAVVAVLFGVGAVIMLRGNEEEEISEGVDDAMEVVAQPRRAATARRVALTSFGVVFAGEWGDITQIATANYAARYHDPISVAIGATLGLWTVAAVAVTAGKKLLDHVDVIVVRRVTGVVLTVFAVLSLVAALR
jgi:putative Ca2+/H+ antiporter (TMEM165/GDT1 family)